MIPALTALAILAAITVTAMVAIARENHHHDTTERAAHEARIQQLTQQHRRHTPHGDQP